jgi:hypothetical protein
MSKVINNLDLLIDRIKNVEDYFEVGDSRNHPSWQGGKVLPETTSRPELGKPQAGEVKEFEWPDFEDEDLVFLLTRSLPTETTNDDLFEILSNLRFPYYQWASVIDMPDSKAIGKRAIVALQQQSLTRAQRAFQQGQIPYQAKTQDGQMMTWAVDAPAFKHFNFQKLVWERSSLTSRELQYETQFLAKPNSNFRILPGSMVSLPPLSVRKPEYYIDSELEPGKFNHAVIVLEYSGDRLYDIIYVS